MAQNNSDPALETRLTSTMMSALGSMPITLTREGSLPLWAPSGSAIEALRRRGMVSCDGRIWARTALGHAVWENR